MADIKMFEHLAAWYRNLEFTGMEEEAMDDILSLFLDDKEKPSKNGRMTASMGIGMLGRSLDDRRLELLAMDILMATDKQEACEALRNVSVILQEEKYKHFEMQSMSSDDENAPDTVATAENI